MKSRPKIVIKVKKTQLYDEYVITNKHIICKFKYLVVCFDHPEQEGDTHGLVCLQSIRLKELMSEQNIVFDSLQDDGYLSDTLKQLKEWHPSIAKVEVDVDNMHEIDDLSEYAVTWANYHDYLTDFKYNKCISTEQEFELFRHVRQNVIDVNVYFKLTKRIEKITDYGVNFNYLHKLLTHSLIDLNNEKTLFLDEVTVEPNQLPFASNCDEEDAYYVYPYMGLFPLYPVVN